MNISTIARNLVTALVTAVVLLWLWPTIAHAQSTTTIRGTGLQPLVEESGSTQTLNIYGPGGVIIAQVATENPAGGTPIAKTRYLLHDHLGSTRVVLDSNNQVLGSFDYSPFGETTPTGNVADVAYRYTGQEVNEALGTYNYHARHYDAGVGRFLGVDPARYSASPYIYVRNNPVNLVDLDGQQPVVFWFVDQGLVPTIKAAKILQASVSAVRDSGLKVLVQMPPSLYTAAQIGESDDIHVVLASHADLNTHLLTVRTGDGAILLTGSDFCLLFRKTCQASGWGAC